jgi:hypothetical protein
MLARILYLEGTVVDLTSVCAQLTMKHNCLCTVIEKLLPAVAFSSVFDPGVDKSGAELTMAPEVEELAHNNNGSVRDHVNFAGDTRQHKRSPAETRFECAEDEDQEMSTDKQDEAQRPYAAPASNSSKPEDPLGNVAGGETGGIKNTDNWNRYQSYSLCSNSTGDIVNVSMGPVEDEKDDTDVDDDDGYETSDSFTSLTSLGSSMGRKRGRDGHDHPNNAPLETPSQQEAEGCAALVPGNEADEGGITTSRATNSDTQSDNSNKQRTHKKKVKREGIASTLRRGRRHHDKKKKHVRKSNKGNIPRIVPSIYDVLQILGDCRVQEVFNSSADMMSPGAASPTNSNVRLASPKMGGSTSGSSMVVYGKGASVALTELLSNAIASKVFISGKPSAGSPGPSSQRSGHAMGSPTEMGAGGNGFDGLDAISAAIDFRRVNGQFKK